MIPRLFRSLIVCFVITVAGTVPTYVLRAADSWINPGDGLWSLPSNWSSNQAPDSTFSSTLITNAGSKTVTVDASTPLTNLTIQRLTISAPPGDTNTLALVDLTTNLPLQLSNSLTVDLGGILTLTNSALTSAGGSLNNGGALNVTNSIVTQSGFATFDIVDGSVWLDGGLIDCSALTSTRIGRINNSSGIFTVKSGTFLASLLQIGTTTAARGALDVSGGMVKASSTVTVGYGVNSTGTVSVTGGQLIATNDITYVGKSGFGQMTVSGGNASFAFLSVGNNADGQVSLTGGQLTMAPRSTNDWLQIGNIGNGQFNMSGGTVFSVAEVHVGDDSSGLGTGSGVASIMGGQFLATNDNTAIGRYGPGQMTVSNATVVLTNVSVGRHDGATGTLIVENNAQVYLLDALSIGRFSNSVGHVFVNGGLLSITNDNIWVGREGEGDMTVSNGLVRARAVFVAMSTVTTDAVTQVVVTNAPSGILTLAGGNMVLTSNMLVGTEGICTGQVSIVGGSMNLIGNGNPGYMAISSGSVSVNGGNVTMDALFLTNASGQLIFNGGTLQSKSAVVSNGSPFVVGDGVHPAIFQLLGGTYLFSDGLVISNNATVTGCGTILGTITNFGTLSTNCVSTTVTITKVTKTGATATVSFTTLAGSNHVVEYKNTLTDSVWTAILPGVIGSGSITNASDTTATTSSRFYRIHVQ